MNPTWNNGQYDVCGCKARGHHEKCEFYHKHDSEYIDYYANKIVEEMEKDVFYSKKVIEQKAKPA
jgi:hypothetical protein